MQIHKYHYSSCVYPELLQTEVDLEESCSIRSLPQTWSFYGGPVGSFSETSDSWQVTGDKWLVTSDWWQVIGDKWLVTSDFETSDWWQVTLKQVIGDKWLVTSDFETSDWWQVIGDFEEVKSVSLFRL